MIRTSVRYIQLENKTPQNKNKKSVAHTVIKLGVYIINKNKCTSYYHKKPTVKVL